MASLTETVALLSCGLLLGCGGAAPTARAPEATTAATPAPSLAPAPTKPTPTPTTAPTFDTSESAVRVFVEGIAKHDLDGVLQATEDEAFARGQVRAYAHLTEARIDGPAPLDAWPYLNALDPSAALFWTTFVAGETSERMLVYVSRRRGGTRWRVVGIRDESDRAKAAEDAEKHERAKKRALAPPERTGKLLSKPVKGLVRVQLDADDAPSAGARVDLYRRVDPSVPFVGGSWIQIADAEVASVSNRVVTLKVLAQKSVMTFNGKPLDHYSPGVPIVLKEPASKSEARQERPR